MVLKYPVISSNYSISDHVSLKTYKVILFQKYNDLYVETSNLLHRALKPRKEDAVIGNNSSKAHEDRKFKSDQRNVSDK